VLELNVTCQCRVPRRPPIRLDPVVAALLADQIRVGHLTPDHTCLTWRCKGCKQIVPIHARELVPR
jgi:hypothetical protein